MKTVYKNFILLDGSKEMQAQKNKLLVVENGVILDICDNFDFTDCRVIDLGGRYLMPGLINLHVHLPAGGKFKKKKSDTKKLAKLIQANSLTRKLGVALCTGFAKTQLYSGVTTIRTVGGIADFDTVLRDKINSGKVVGPRILASNTAICPVDGHMEGTVAKVVTSVEECEKMVTELKNQNVDLIKLMITGGVLDAKVKGEPGILKMNSTLVKACTQTAHKLNLKVAAHVESEKGVLVALENEVDTIEHGSALTNNMIELFKKNNSSYICTISPALPLAKFDKDILGVDDTVIYNSNVVFDGVINGAKACLENGITVGMGTDTGCPFITHYNMWRELHYFTKYLNVTPAFALHTATLVNAKIAGVDNITGSIEKGKSADFLVVNDNPLEHFKNLSNPYMVVIKGKEIKCPKVKKYAFNDNLLDKYM